jgi:hypothetical protein
MAELTFLTIALLHVSAVQQLAAVKTVVWPQPGLSCCGAAIPATSDLCSAPDLWPW